MGFFDDMIAADIDVMADEVGEDVVYKPKVGDARTIRAVVNRDINAGSDDRNTNSIEVMHVDVKNHATLGISSVTMDTGSDRISLAYRVGGAVKAYVLGKPISVSPTNLVFELK